MPPRVRRTVDCHWHLLTRPQRQVGRHLWDLRESLTKPGLPLRGLFFCIPQASIWGVLVCLKVVSNTGNEFGIRSIPEYLGSRYQSEWMRVLVSLFSLLLLFYLAGQLVAGVVMFEVMLGLPPDVALGITAMVLIVYVVLGGAHAGILTDVAQGCMRSASTWLSRPCS